MRPVGESALQKLVVVPAQSGIGRYPLLSSAHPMPQRLQPQAQSARLILGKRDVGSGHDPNAGWPTR